VAHGSPGDRTLGTYLDYTGLGCILFAVEELGRRWIEEQPITRHVIVAAGAFMLAGAVALALARRIKSMPPATTTRSVSRLAESFDAVAHSAITWLITAAVIVFGVPLTFWAVSPAPKAVVQQGFGFAESRLPPKQRSRETVSELLDESGAILNVVNSGFALADEWRSIANENPELLCITHKNDIDGQITTLAGKLSNAAQEMEKIYDQNRIDQQELNQLFPANSNHQMFAGVLGGLSQYEAAILAIARYTSCEDLIRSNKVPQAVVVNDRVLNQFYSWLYETKRKTEAYRDRLRAELRDAH
jgi:hypothetical protein